MDSTAPTLRRAVLSVATALQMLAAHAQPVPHLSTDEGLRRQEERAREQQKELEPHADVRRPAPPTATLPELPAEQPCFFIREIALEGKDALRFHWLSAATDAFVGRCIGAQGVARIAAYLDAQLIEQGFVTSRVGLGPQNLNEGRLAIQLLAGRIGEVRMVDAERKAPDARWGTWVNAFPTTAGRLLNARDLEQGVEQMKRLPSQNVTNTLSPGAAPDTSILTIEREAGDLTQRVRGGVTLDNSGSQTLGRTNLSANLALDNPLGLNDIASVSANSNAEHPRADHCRFVFVSSAGCSNQTLDLR